MASRGRAGVERHRRVARPVRPHILVALGVACSAEVQGNGNGAVPGDLRWVLNVAGRAKPRIQLLPVGRHSRIAEFTARMAVVGIIQFVVVTAGFVDGCTASAASANDGAPWQVSHDISSRWCASVVSPITRTRRPPPTNSDAATNVAAIKVATTNDQMIRAGISWIPQYE